MNNDWIITETDFENADLDMWEIYAYLCDHYSEGTDFELTSNSDGIKFLNRSIFIDNNSNNFPDIIDSEFGSGGDNWGTSTGQAAG